MATKNKGGGRGFASMDPERHRRISQKGGKASGNSRKSKSNR